MVMGKIAGIVLVMTLLAACAGPSGTAPPDAPPESQSGVPYAHTVSVVFINVGKADSILLKIDDKAYLIDAGHKKSVPALFRALAAMEIETIDGLFLTHTHSDHIGGTEALARKHTVNRIYSAEISQLNKNGENKIVNLARDLGLPYTSLSAGDEIEAGDGIAFRVIGPLALHDDDNDNSLVLMIELNGKRFLFTGDMQYGGEALLLSAGTDLAAHVLKVGNHGNPDATSPAFAKAVSPEYAVISTDTSESAKSANVRVITALGRAEVLVTQNYSLGIRMDTGTDGTITAGELEPAASGGADMEITGIDIEKQTITIRNNGPETDVSGYFIFSERGSEVFVFPEGSVMDAGQVVTVACTGGEGDYIWEEKTVWNKKNPDAGVLYDCYGGELFRRES